MSRRTAEPSAVIATRAHRIERTNRDSAARRRRRRILMVAGEASGDLHGADLAAQIFARAPACELFGIAGERMRASGVRALVKVEEIAGLGVVELASTIGRTRSLRCGPCAAGHSASRPTWRS